MKKQTKKRIEDAGVKHVEMNITDKQMNDEQVDIAIRLISAAEEAGCRVDKIIFA